MLAQGRGRWFALLFIPRSERGQLGEKLGTERLIYKEWISLPPDSLQTWKEMTTQWPITKITDIILNQKRYWTTENISIILQTSTDITGSLRKNTNTTVDTRKRNVVRGVKVIVVVQRVMMMTLIDISISPSPAGALRSLTTADILRTCSNVCLLFRDN